MILFNGVQNHVNRIEAFRPFLLAGRPLRIKRPTPWKWLTPFLKDFPGRRWDGAFRDRVCLLPDSLPHAPKYEFVVEPRLDMGGAHVHPMN